MFYRGLKDCLKTIAAGAIDFIYPPLCLHCSEYIRENSSVFCSSCSSLLELIQPEERCRLCFSYLESSESIICAKCYHTPLLTQGIAAAFDYIGPPATLIKNLKYSGKTYLAEGAGAFIAAQFLNLEWPIPDFIIPVPIALTHRLERGFNQSELLAESASKILGVPVKNALLRKSGDYSQAGLFSSQRLALEGSSIVLKKKQGLQDKCLLMIDDVMTTGTTLKKCAEALIEDCPSFIYGITLCQAVH